MGDARNRWREERKEKRSDRGEREREEDRLYEINLTPVEMNF